MAVNLSVLSPHRDDAVFSLGLSLRHLATKPIRIHILTVFTSSAYAPRVAPRRDLADQISFISGLRQREDRKALALAGRDIKQKSLNWLDAPLRLGVSPDDVLKPRKIDDHSREVVTLANTITARLRNGLVLAPLGLGKHVDHLTVRAAALQALKSGLRLRLHLGFYEDLPYAAGVLKTELQEALAACEQESGCRLKCAILARTPHPVPRKRKLAMPYTSQVDRWWADRIARHSLNYRGGERIWVPARGSRWKLVQS